MGEKKQKSRERGEGKSFGQFDSIICSLHEVVLSHISIMCLFWLTALSLVQTLVAEDVNWLEFNCALELRPSK